MKKLTKKEMRVILATEMQPEVYHNPYLNRYHFPNERVSFNEDSSFEAIFEQIYRLGFDKGQVEAQKDIIRAFDMKKIYNYIRRLENDK